MKIKSLWHWKDDIYLAVTENLNKDSKLNLNGIRFFPSSNYRERQFQEQAQEKDIYFVVVEKSDG